MNAQQNGDAILGTWYNQEQTSKIHIIKMNNMYYGKIVWLKEPTDKTTGKPRTDHLNPDKSKQNVPLMNLTVLRRFTWKNKNLYEGGLIYDPKNGKEYSCKINMVDQNTLDVRGYVGISLLGRTAVWKRAE
ncbi:MAG: DUF2147 domain-containing protein [Bacteroidetes bacterium]|nr:DUF2147 domain-containing protein [Bacteroidota bacterium]